MTRKPDSSASRLSRNSFVATIAVVLSLFGNVAMGEADGWLPNLAAVDQIASEISQNLAEGSVDAAFGMLTFYAHTDDKNVINNLVEARKTIPRMFANTDSKWVLKQIESVRFLSSFYRIRYDVIDTDRIVRIMYTFRKKTRGWKVNQIVASTYSAR